MRHTKWIDRCCEDLLARPEYPSDVYLKTFIDIQLLSRRSEELICSQDTVLNDASSGAAWKTQFNLLEEQSQLILAEGAKAGSHIPREFSPFCLPLLMGLGLGCLCIIILSFI